MTKRWISIILILAFTLQSTNAYALRSRSAKKIQSVTGEISGAMHEAVDRLPETFMVEDEVCTIKRIDDINQIKSTLDKWFFAGADRYFGRSQWDGIINQKGFLINIESKSGKLLGLAYAHKGACSFPAGWFGESETLKQIYWGDYVEVSNEYRGKGVLGRVLTARTIEESLNDETLDDDVKGVIVIHPAEDSEYAKEGERARDFASKIGFVEMNTSEYLPEDDQEHNYFMVLRQGAAEALFGTVKKELQASEAGISGAMHELNKEDQDYSKACQYLKAVYPHAYEMLQKADVLYKAGIDDDFSYLKNALDFYEYFLAITSRMKEENLTPEVGRLIQAVVERVKELHLEVGDRVSKSTSGFTMQGRIIPLQIRLIEKLKEMSAMKGQGESLVIVDLGIGESGAPTTFDFVGMLQEAGLSNVSVIGVDINSTFVHQAQEQLSKMKLKEGIKVEFRKGEFKLKDLGLSNVDMVIASNVLLDAYYAPEEQREARKLLSDALGKDGVLVVSEGPSVGEGGIQFKIYKKDGSIETEDFVDEYEAAKLPLPVSVAEPVSFVSIAKSLLGFDKIDMDEIKDRPIAFICSPALLDNQDILAVLPAISEALEDKEGSCLILVAKKGQRSDMEQKKSNWQHKSKVAVVEEDKLQGALSTLKGQIKIYLKTKGEPDIQNVDINNPLTQDILNRLGTIRQNNEQLEELKKQIVNQLQA